VSEPSDSAPSAGLDAERLAHEKGRTYLEHRDRERHALNQSIQKLTFYVVGVEAALCGYLLLYADKLRGLPFLSALFLLSAVAATSGIAWRYHYNEAFT
jgi:hypothetical protein